MAVNKDMKQLMEEVEREGWVIIQTKGDHFKWVAPSGGFFFSSQTASDHRAVKNIERDLKRLGFVRLVKQNRRKR